MQFVFTGHTLDVGRRELRRGADFIAVEPQVLDLLIYLVENRDHVVSKDDLIASVWGGRIVSDATLSSRISAARRAVGDSGKLLLRERKKFQARSFRHKRRDWTLTTRRRHVFLWHKSKCLNVRFRAAVGVIADVTQTSFEGRC